ncbi:unnamed protein product [Lupinus luteus]|uniref:Pre-rRNA-processing protein TSR2 homolog n=1 Tax=Lupinus luteus TaxID=3873 RepID=A0AAV1YE25_LUPLU
MDSMNRKQQHQLGGTEPVSNIVFLQKGIMLLLSRWYALQMAINNQWGGSDSLQKSHHLASHIFSFFSSSNAPVPVEDLENLLHEWMLLTFNTEIEDGSIEEYCKQVAEELMGIHEEYLLHKSS